MIALRGRRGAVFLGVLAAGLFLLGVGLLLATNDELPGFVSVALGLALFIVALSRAPSEGAET